MQLPGKVNLHQDHQQVNMCVKTLGIVVLTTFLDLDLVSLNMIWRDFCVAKVSGMWGDHQIHWVFSVNLKLFLLHP